MQKKIKISAQLKRILIQKIGIKKEDFENFSEEIKNLDNKKDGEKISEIQKNFFGEIEKNIGEKMMNFAKNQDFEHAKFLRDLLLEFQNEINSKQKFSEDLKEIFGGEIKNISCFGESENFSGIIHFENGVCKKEKNKVFPRSNIPAPSSVIPAKAGIQGNKNSLEEIFERNLKIFEKKIENEKKSELKFFYKKLNKKDFSKIFEKIYGEKNQEKNKKEDKKIKTEKKEKLNIFLDNYFLKNEILEENGIKINYFGIFQKEKNIENKIENFNEKKLEKNFIGLIPLWKFDNKNFEIILENPDKNGKLFGEDFNEIFSDFIKFLSENFNEKNFYIYGNSKKYEKKFNEFGIKKIKTLNGKKFSEDFGIIPENIGKFGASKNKTEGFFGKFSTGEKSEKIIFPDLFLINSEENFENIFKKFSEKFGDERKFFLANKKNLEKISEKNSEGKKFLEKIFNKSERFLKKIEENKNLKNSLK